MIGSCLICLKDILHCQTFLFIRTKNYHPRTSDSPRMHLYKSSTPWRFPQASTFLTQCTWTFSSPLHIRTHLKHNRSHIALVNMVIFFVNVYFQSHLLLHFMLWIIFVATKTLSRIDLCSTKADWSSAMHLWSSGH